jgi:hypothetical protein
MRVNTISTYRIELTAAEMHVLEHYLQAARYGHPVNKDELHIDPEKAKDIAESIWWKLPHIVESDIGEV